MVKLVIVDMDGTFLDDEKNISPEFPKVYNALKEKGVNFCIASGRQIASIRKELKKYIDLPDDEGIFVSENGTLVEINGKLVKVDEFEEPLAKRLLDRVKTLSGKRVVYSTKTRSYIDNMDEDSRKNAEIYLPNYKYVRNFDEVEELPVKLAINSKHGYDDDFQRIVDEFSDEAHVCTSGFEWLDIIPKGSNKGSGVKKVQEILNISSAETMAFGDQMNDFEMLSQADFSYAMDNAVDEVKKVANFTAPSNNEYGVIQVLKKHFDIR